eukprot:277530-Chlamydomonas_euryale.AAC.1
MAASASFASFAPHLQKPAQGHAQKHDFPPAAVCLPVEAAAAAGRSAAAPTGHQTESQGKSTMQASGCTCLVPAQRQW